MTHELVPVSYLWRTYPMVAVKAKDRGARVVHLGRKRVPGGTLCGLPPSRIVDTHVATGWPDCAACIELAHHVD